MITDRLDAFMAWYGRLGSENPMLAFLLLPIPLVIVSIKATYLILKRDKRGRKVLDEVI